MENKNVFNITKHFLKRQAVSGIKKEDINTVLEYGKKLHRTGICFYTVPDRLIARLSLSERLKGLCVLAWQNTLITVYKNPKAISNTKKLSKLNLKKYY